MLKKFFPVSIENRAFFWEDFVKHAVSDFLSAVEDAYADFEPYRVYNEHLTPDKDAPVLEKMRDMAVKIYDMAKEREAEADKDYDAWETAQPFFYAWELGLCYLPLKQRNIRQYGTLGNIFDNNRNWEEISEFRQSKDVSFQDTEQAITAWLKSKERSA